MIPTGLVLRPPEGYYIQVCSRSGLAQKSVFVANAPGIIDPDYTGELFVLLHNSGFETQWIEHEHRIAQVILTPIVWTKREVRELKSPPSSNGRGEAGFGSTGL
jgi:dUTP pyrophosphatase